MPVPELRFKGFNDDWEEALLTDIVHFHNGKGHEGVVDENGEYILINSKFISSDRAVFKRVSECHQKVFDDSLVMVMSDVPNGKALAKFIHIVDGKEYALNQRIGMLVFKEEFSSKFYQYPLNRNKYYLAFDSGVGQTNLRKDEVLECPIYKLSLREQTKITSFLSAVDEKISRLTQKHQLLSQYKKGMIQKLFSQQIRFKADDGSDFGEWEEVRLGNLVDLTSGFAFKSDFFSEDGNKLITPKNFTTTGKANFTDTNTKWTTEISDKKYICRPNDLLVLLTDLTQSCELLGKPILLSQDDGNVLLNQRIVKIIPNRKLEKPFLLYLLLTDDFHELIVSTASGTTVKHSSNKVLQSFNFYLPCLEEQTKIANFLSAIDQKIEVVAQQIEQAKTWKKGLLQQMFV